MLRLFWALASALPALGRWLRGFPREAAVALGAAASGTAARPARLWLAFAMILPVALVAASLLPQVSLVMSPSINAWAVRPAPGSIAKGDYVMFTLRHPIAGPAPVSVTKLVLCGPGDRLTHVETPSITSAGTRDGRYFCNGALLGVSLPYAGHGLKLDHMQWSGVIPAGQAYVGSHHPRGFDSRYFGLVPIASLTRMERVL
jgi:type IV secretory pathway protease TraF